MLNWFRCRPPKSRYSLLHVHRWLQDVVTEELHNGLTIQLHVFGCRKRFLIASQSPIIRSGSFLMRKIKEEDSSKWRLCCFPFNSWGTHLLSLMTFLIGLKCRTVVKSSTLISFVTFLVVIWVFGSTTSFNLLLSTSDGQSPRSSFSRL